MREFTVKVSFDHEVSVWYISDCTLPGLVLESEKLDDLIERCLLIAPDLAGDNCHLIDDFDIGSKFNLRFKIGDVTDLQELAVVAA